IGILTIQTRDASEHVVTVLVDRGQRGTSITRRVNLENLWRLRKSLIRIDFRPFRMRDGDEVYVIDEERFLQLICDTQLVTPVAPAQEIGTNADVLIGIRHVESSGRVE